MENLLIKSNLKLKLTFLEGTESLSPVFIQATVE